MTEPRDVSVPSYGVPKKLDRLSPPMMLPEPTRNKDGANSLYCQCCVNKPKIFVTLEDANSFYLLYIDTQFLLHSAILGTTISNARDNVK